MARLLGAQAGAVHLGQGATERSLKALSAAGTLGHARVVHFATHGLLRRDRSVAAALAEPALVLTPPDAATERGRWPADRLGGAALKLDADWVMLSACNTAAGGDEPGAEALSGLARAFFYAGARALLVSHWAVDSEATVELVTRVFSEMKADRRLGRAEALRRSMLAMIDTWRPHRPPCRLGTLHRGRRGRQVTPEWAPALDKVAIPNGCRWPLLLRLHLAPGAPS